MTDCGGCKGLGSHRKFCPRHPNYHPWRILVAHANQIGDTLGSNEPGLANAAYGLASRIDAAIEDHPWRAFAHGVDRGPDPQS